MNNPNILFVTWRGCADQSSDWKPVGKLEFVLTENSEGFYRFRYTKGALTLFGFRPFCGMEDLYSIYDSDELLPLFTSRLMPKSRPEFADYLRWSGFDPSDPPSPIAILAVTEGRRMTDYVEVFPCPRQTVDGYAGQFFIHGVQRLGVNALQRTEHLVSGEQLTLVPENHNPYDPFAIAIYTHDNMKIGHLPRYLTKDIRELLQQCPDSPCVSVVNNNINAPLQHQILCRITSCWPDRFTPCSGEDFQPITE